VASVAIIRLQDVCDTAQARLDDSWLGLCLVLGIEGFGEFDSRGMDSS